MICRVFVKAFFWFLISNEEEEEEEENGGEGMCYITGACNMPKKRKKTQTQQTASRITAAAWPLEAQPQPHKTTKPTTAVSVSCSMYVPCMFHVPAPCAAGDNYGTDTDTKRGNIAPCCS
jgi:hypothetical protein